MAYRGVFLEFDGISEELDVYNPTAPFANEYGISLAARVEPRKRETDSKVMFFIKSGTAWKLDENAPIFPLQDPFFSRIGNQIIFGGVEVFYKNNKLSWRTLFYKGDSIYHLEKFFEGPEGMKDIRLTELPNKRIGIFTRPQGKIGRRGNIGYADCPSLDKLPYLNLEDAPLLEDLFDDESWKGANEVYVLDASTLGILSHNAYMDSSGAKHYSAACFKFDYLKRKVHNLKVIAARSDFPPCAAKKSPELNDVLFPGGMIIQGKYAELYANLSDTKSGKIRIPNPFI